MRRKTVEDELFKISVSSLVHFADALIWIVWQEYDGLLRELPRTGAVADLEQLIVRHREAFRKRMEEFREVQRARCT